MEVFDYLLGKKAGGGSEPPVLQNKSITITENETQTIQADEGYDGLSSVAITTNVAGGGGLDFTELGFSNTPEGLQVKFNYALNIKETWEPATSYYNKYANEQINQNIYFFPSVDTSTGTNFRNMFYGCTKLISVASINTSNGQRLDSMFNSCYELMDVPVLNLSSAVNLNSMFYNCNKLTDNSLNNILASCITATSYQGTKTLAQLGLDSSYASRIGNLSNYQAFLNAGWTTGF